MATTTKKDEKDQTEQVTPVAASDTPVTTEAAEEAGLKSVEKDVVREYLASGTLPAGKKIQLRYVGGSSRWVYVE